MTVSSNIGCPKAGAELAMTAPVLPTRLPSRAEPSIID
jgi:hypothetical protein